MVLRYINHSCAPNCVAEVVTFERGHKIIISCVRRIAKGEEVGIFWLYWWCNIFGRVQPWMVSSLLTVFQLCFDYQLECVEGQHKTACHCGAPECRKWINWGKEWQKKTNLNTFLAVTCVRIHLCTEGKKASHSSHFTNKQKAQTQRDERIYTLVHQDGARQRDQDVTCAICGMVCYETLLSVCMYLCVCCTWGAETTSEWESTVQGAALLLIKGRPFCCILLMYTIWLNVDITEWGMYSKEYCEGNINLH